MTGPVRDDLSGAEADPSLRVRHEIDAWDIRWRTSGELETRFWNDIDGLAKLATTRVEDILAGRCPGLDANRSGASDTRHDRSDGAPQVSESVNGVPRVRAFMAAVDRDWLDTQQHVGLLRLPDGTIHVEKFFPAAGNRTVVYYINPHDLEDSWSTMQAPGGVPHLRDMSVFEILKKLVLLTDNLSRVSWGDDYEVRTPSRRHKFRHPDLADLPQEIPASADAGPLAA